MYLKVDTRISHTQALNHHHTPFSHLHDEQRAIIQHRSRSKITSKIRAKSSCTIPSVLGFKHWGRWVHRSRALCRQQRARWSLSRRGCWPMGRRWWSPSESVSFRLWWRWGSSFRPTRSIQQCTRRECLEWWIHPSVFGHRSLSSEASHLSHTTALVSRSCQTCISCFVHKY